MQLKNSIVLKQTFILILMSIFFASSIMMIWLTFLTSHFKNVNTVESNKAKAKMLASAIEDYEQKKISSSALNFLLNNSPYLLDGSVFLDINRNIPWPTHYIPSNSNFWEGLKIEEIEDSITNYRPDILNGNEVIFSLPYTLQQESTNLLLIGIPIRNFDTTIPNSFQGAIYVIKNLNQDELSLLPMILAFIAALFLTIGMMIFPALYVINLIVNPLFEIKDVSKNIAEGNFNVRAKEGYRAEFKVLAESLNLMAKNLKISFKNLEEESFRLSQILNSLNEGIIAISPQGIVTHINPVFYEYFPDEKIQLLDNLSLNNTLITDNINMVRQDGFERTVDINYRDKIYKTHFLPLNKDDNQLAEGYEDLFSPNEASGEIEYPKNQYGVVCLFKDITQEASLEQTRKDYVANVSHELKTPITALRCLIEPMLDGMVKKEKDRQNYYQTIYNETLRLSRLIDDILELSRLQSGKLNIEKQVFDLASLLLSINTKFTPIMKEKEINFSINIPLVNCPEVFSNQDRIEQILYILLDNAMKFTPKNGSIIIDGYTNENKFYLLVKDSGTGISSEDQKHIFERFYKADKSRTSRGTGLGLSIAHEIMSQLNEKITVSSELNKGSTFTLSLALAIEK